MGRAMAHAVSCWPLTAESRLRCQDKVALGQALVQVLRFSPVSIIPRMTHTHLRLHVAVTRRAKGRSLGTFQKFNSLPEIEGALDIKGLPLKSLKGYVQ
jgi:hypothetical protein